MTPAQARELLESWPGATVAVGDPLTVSVAPESWTALAAEVRDRVGATYFSFLTAIDWKDAGLEVVALVDRLEPPLTVVMRTRLAPGSTHLPTLTRLYAGADWMERECFDMFGVVFDGHADLRRILLPDDWQGHPLLKAYDVDTPHPPYR